MWQGAPNISKSRIEHILTQEKIDKPRGNWKMKLDFASPEHQSKNVLVTKSLSIGYTPENPLLENINLFIAPVDASYWPGFPTVRARLLSFEPLLGNCLPFRDIPPGWCNQTWIHGPGTGIAQPCFKRSANHSKYFGNERNRHAQFPALFPLQRRYRPSSLPRIFIWRACALGAIRNFGRTGMHLPNIG